MVPSCMSTMDLTIDRPSPEPLARSSGARRAAPEALEHVGHLVGRDAGAGVGHHQSCAGRGRDSSSTSTRPLDGRELDGVADEVGQDLPDAWWVVRLADRLVRQVDDQVDALATGDRFGLLDGVLDHRTHVVHAQIEGHQTRIELGHLQQVGGQPVEPLDLAMALLQELVASGGIVARRPRAAAR